MTTLKLDLGALAHVVLTPDAIQPPAITPAAPAVEFVQPVAEAWTAPEVPEPPEHEPEPWYKRAFNIVKGVGALGKTMLGGSVVTLLGFADRFDLVDVMTNVKGWLGDSERAGTILIAVGVLFIGAKLAFMLFGPGDAEATRGIDDGE